MRMSTAQKTAQKYETVDDQHDPEDQRKQVLQGDALFRTPHPTHLSISEAVEAAQKVGARHGRRVHPFAARGRPPGRSAPMPGQLP